MHLGVGVGPFFKLLSGLIFFAVLTAQAADRGIYSVLQGATDLKSAQLTVLHRKTETLKFMAKIGQRTFKASQVDTNVQPFSEWAITRVQFQDLPSGFSGRILIQDTSGKTLDDRGFRSLDPAAKKARIAMLSCAAGYLYHGDIWQQLNDSNPDLVLFLGDNIYGDRPSLIVKKPADPEQLWSLYVGARQIYDFYFRKDLIPALATWDDHDFGTDDGNSEYQYAAESEEIFSSFFAQKSGVSTTFRRGPGISSAITAFGMDIVLLDGRRFRSATTGAGATGWGQAQLNWIQTQLKMSDRPLWLADGENFFAGYSDHSTNVMFPGEFEQLMAMVRGSKRLVGFISGDVHFSEISDLEPDLIGYPSVEVAASSMHSLTLPWLDKTWSNPRRRVANSSHNFVLMDVDAQPAVVKGTFTSVLRDGQAAFTERFLIQR